MIGSDKQALSQARSYVVSGEVIAVEPKKTSKFYVHIVEFMSMNVHKFFWKRNMKNSSQQRLLVMQRPSTILELLFV